MPAFGVRLSVLSAQPGIDVVAFVGRNVMAYAHVLGGFDSATLVLNCSFNTGSAAPLFSPDGSSLLLLVDDAVSAVG
jgi:hypothetical protein